MLLIENYGGKVKYIHIKKQNLLVIYKKDSSWLQTKYIFISIGIALLGFLKGNIALNSFRENINIAIQFKETSRKVKIEDMRPDISCGKLAMLIEHHGDVKRKTSTKH